MDIDVGAFMICDNWVLRKDSGSKWTYGQRLSRRLKRISPRLRDEGRWELALVGVGQDWGGGLPSSCMSTLSGRLLSH